MVKDWGMNWCKESCKTCWDLKKKKKVYPPRRDYSCGLLQWGDEWWCFGSSAKEEHFNSKRLRAQVYNGLSKQSKWQIEDDLNELLAEEIICFKFEMENKQVNIANAS